MDLTFDTYVFNFHIPSPLTFYALTSFLCTHAFRHLPNEMPYLSSFLLTPILSAHIYSYHLARHLLKHTTTYDRLPN